MQTSRFITSPDIVKKENNHTVVIIDASTNEIQDISLFCQVGYMYYDIYLFRSDTDKEEWLLSALQDADSVLTSVDSPVAKNPYAKSFGAGSKYKVPLNYFQEYENATKEATIG